MRASIKMLGDIWYTCWVDAGKPDLSAITPGWSAEAQSKLEAELKVFKDNKLLENKLLLSKKN